MRLGITGAGATGKSTLLQQCKQDPSFKDYKFLGSVTRGVYKEMGFDGEHTQYVKTPQENYRLQKRILAAKHAQVIGNYGEKSLFTDRILLDHFAYLCVRNTEVIENNFFKTIQNVVRFDIESYDLIFYCEPFDSIEIEGFRDPSKAVQHTVDAVISSYLNKRFENTPKIIRLGNDISVEQRLDMVKSFIRMDTK